MRVSARERFERTRATLLRPDDLSRTLDRLCDEGRLSPDRAQLIREQLPHALSDSAYILRHLGAHLTLGVIFAFDMIPLPLGTVSRVLWVLANRAYEATRGSADRAEIHSFRVMLVAAIPWLGYGAYLLPLRSESVELTWLLAHHVSFQLHGTSFEEFIAAKPRMVRRAGSWLIPDISERATRGG